VQSNRLGVQKNIALLKRVTRELKGYFANAKAVRAWWGGELL
jgi:hypothetical protein